VSDAEFQHVVRQEARRGHQGMAWIKRVSRRRWERVAIGGKLPFSLGDSVSRSVPKLISRNVWIPVV
jgi:hypothetical protein